METDAQLNFLYALLPLALIVFAIALGVILLTRQFHKKIAEQVRQQENIRLQHQHDLLISSIAAQEEERKRIAQDLHDELGAALSIARMNLLQLERGNAAGNDTLVLALQNIRSLTETSLKSMRRISHELMPYQLLKSGLVHALEEVAARAGDSIKIVLHTPGHLPELPWPVTLGLYRILMELINNTIKHAHASRIEIKLADTEDALILCSYTDDGQGFMVDSDANGLGLKNIQGRVNAINGRLRLDNTETGGFLAAIKIPLGYS